MKYGKTKQFGDTVRDMKHALRYKGVDENDEPIYSNDPLPTLEFTGTVKLHGTNAGLTWNIKDGIRYMSRNNFVTNGHFGFPEIMNQEAEAIEDLISQIVDFSDYETGEAISIYGEWAGPGVQKGVAISEIPQKVWFVFGVKITDSEGNGRWMQGLENIVVRHTNRIINLPSTLMYIKKIDLENPALAQNDLIERTQQVEAECPIAKLYGISGIGEGVVWETFHNGQRFIFKVKGEKHSSSKTKTLAPIDVEKAKSIADFIDYAITPNRVEQAMFEVAQSHGITVEELSKGNTGQIMKWVQEDVVTEEAPTMKASGLEWRDVGRQASDTARRLFFDKLNQNL